MTEAELVLVKLVETDSRLSVSNLKILTTIQKLIGEPGHLERFTKQSPIKLKLGNLLYDFPGTGDEPPLIFVGHTDTIEPSAEWHTNPLQVTLRRKRLTGLGAVDMKAGIAAMILLARHARTVQPRRRLVLIFDGDEEGTVAGAENILTRHNFRNAWVVIPEATGNQLLTAQRACLDFRVRTKGFAAHASLATHNPQNSALYRANAILDALMKDETSRLHKLHDPRFGVAVQSIGTITGGTAINTVADRVEFFGTRRLLPHQSLAEEEKQLRALVRRADRTASVSILFRGEGFTTDRESPLIRALAPLAPRKGFIIENGWTEAGRFKHWGDVVVFGPGTWSEPHQPNETLIRSQLGEYVDAVTQFVFGKA